MYFLILFITAFLLIFLLATNWPIKFYHYYFLKKLARLYETTPVRFGLLLSSVFSEITILNNSNPIRVRFLESSVDSLNKANSGLELRRPYPTPIILEFYHSRLSKQQWGDFKRFLTGNNLIDSKWVVLTPDPVRAEEFWQIKQNVFEPILNNPLIEQILFSKDEMIIRFRHLITVSMVQTVVELLMKMN